MKIYKTTFKKQNGDIREIKYVPFKDLTPEMVKLILPKFKNEHKARELKEGMELVYDIDKKDLRILNKKTLLKEIEEYNEDLKL